MRRSCYTDTRRLLLLVREVDRVDLVVPVEAILRLRTLSHVEALMRACMHLRSAELWGLYGFGATNLRVGREVDDADAVYGDVPHHQRGSSLPKVIEWHVLHVPLHLHPAGARMVQIASALE